MYSTEFKSSLNRPQPYGFNAFKSTNMAYVVVYSNLTIYLHMFSKRFLILPEHVLPGLHLGYQNTFLPDDVS